MRSYSTAVTNYLSSGKPYQEHSFLTFKVKDKDNHSSASYHFSTREENVTVTVVNQDTGNDVSRDYHGGGAIVSYDPIVRSAGTKIRTQRLQLSGLDDSVLDMVQGYNCANAPFEWHVGIVEADTGLLVDTPTIEFVGFVNMITPGYAPLDPETGQGGGAVFDIEVVSLFRALTRTNTAVRSREEGRTISDDPVYDNSDASNTWSIMWGKEKKSHKQRNGGGGGKDDNGGKAVDIFSNGERT